MKIIEYFETLMTEWKSLAKSMYDVRVPPSRVLLLLRRCVVCRHPSPRSEIAAHSSCSNSNSNSSSSPRPSGSSSSSSSSTPSSSIPATSFPALGWSPLLMSA